MSRVPAEPLRLNYLIKAGAVYLMTGEIFRSVAVRTAEIMAVPAGADGLDDLAVSGTVVSDAYPGQRAGAVIRPCRL